MDDAALSRLAEAAGIAACYWDINGNLHETTPETARQLLAALGLAAANAAEIATSLRGLADDPWREVLPPVVVATEAQAIAVAARLPAYLAGQAVRWSIDLELGGTVGGEIQWASLPVDAAYDLYGTTTELRHLTLPALPAGYHRLRLEAGAVAATAMLVVAPPRCYLPPGAPGARYWGIDAQLYAIRSGTNWGIGDFGDLGTLVDWSAAAGADAVGLNPLHALFLDHPDAASPYSPSSRLLLNPLYLDVTAIPDFAESAAARTRFQSKAFSEGLRAVRAAQLIDYPCVAAAKLDILGLLHRHFLAAHAADARGAAFRKFVEDGGPGLQRLAVWQALAEHFRTHLWGQWPAAFRTPDSGDVARFVATHPERLSFYQYLQWQSEVQLAAAQDRAATGGMRLGLCRDLAVGVDAEGADHWANQPAFVGAARIGAPPDPFSEAGQEWGVIPFNPRRLRAAAYAPFISMLRANMRHAGALRIDHIMGWQRLFVIRILA